MTAFPSAVLAAAVVAAEKVSFLLVGSAALWLRSEITTVADADAVIEPGEPSIHRLREALAGIAIVPVPSVSSLLGGGLAPGYAYEVLCDLARPWTTPVNLVHGQGNFGSRGNDPPANFRYTQARITRAGRVALAAERGETAPLPIALINGNTYREGLRPPLRPRAIIDAVREVIKRPEVPDKELAGIVGLPYFLTGCMVTGSLAALAAGRRTELRLQARLSISDDRTKVVIENIPPNISTDDVAHIIASRAPSAMGERAFRPPQHHPPPPGRSPERNVATR